MMVVNNPFFDKAGYFLGVPRDIGGVGPLDFHEIYLGLEDAQAMHRLLESRWHPEGRFQSHPKIYQGVMSHGTHIGGDIKQYTSMVTFEGFRENNSAWSLGWCHIMTPRYIWSDYSDLTRPHPRWWFSKGNPRLFQGNLGWWNIVSFGQIYVLFFGVGGARVGLCCVSRNFGVDIRGSAMIGSIKIHRCINHPNRWILVHGLPSLHRFIIAGLEREKGVLIHFLKRGLKMKIHLFLWCLRGIYTVYNYIYRYIHIYI